MSFMSNLGSIIRFLIVAVIYLIILYSLKIMKNDMNNNTESEGENDNIEVEDIIASHNSYKGKKNKIGLEILEIYKKDEMLKVGSIIPFQNNLTIGRDKKNNISLPDPYVSKYHAKIYKKNDQLIVKDNRSTNGIEVNDKRVRKEKEIILGDVIKIGNYLFKVIG